MATKERILNEIETVVANLLYYDRKDDEDLPVCEIEKAVKDGTIDIDEMVDKFKELLCENIL